jgi:ferritin-like protein
MRPDHVARALRGQFGTVSLFGTHMAIEYHEPPGELSARTRDEHRAISSLVEEFEAIDWYQHRLDVCQDEALRALIKHNRDEEMEHAAMALEWLRRRIPDLDRRLRAHLFKDDELLAREEEVNGDATRMDLGIGAMAPKRSS